MSELIGKWEQPQGQPYPGLWFEFNPDGAFRAGLEAMGIYSSGTYAVSGDQIDMDQTKHTLGVVGKFLGLFQVDGDTLTMTLGDPNNPRPSSLMEKGKRLYKKI